MTTKEKLEIARMDYKAMLERNGFQSSNAFSLLEDVIESIESTDVLSVNDYQTQAARTLIDAPDFQITDKQVMITWNAIGLSGEAGEVADLVKKGIFHQQGLDVDKLKKELGDVLWYVAGMCTTLGISLDDVMKLNIEKLKARFPEGYSAERTTYREGLAS